jgi:hypothetical protein
MAAFFNKTYPYKITDRKIIKVEHNIIDSSRCLIIIVQLHFRNLSGESKNKFSQKLLLRSHKYLKNKVCVVYTFYIRRKNLEKLLSKKFFLSIYLPSTNDVLNNCGVYTLIDKV